MKNFNVSKDGFYGDFGGAFIPEMLFPNIDELQKNYIKISESKEFKKEFNQLLHDYVGRPTPLYYATTQLVKYF
jgi:tryptophan synthase beta chain